MSTAPQLVVHRDKELMAQAAAARLITRIVDAQASRGSASVVLTGGRNGNGLLAALSAAPARDAIDWSRLDLWWGDERFLPEGDPERNVTQAREVLLDSVPLDPKRVHAMPASDGPYGTDVDAAAAAYAEELAAAAGPENHGPVPTFDVLMLGVGPDTHVASLFPELPAVRETDRTVVGVHGAPKPPPTRVTLTLPAIRAAREVWLLAAGEDKAQAAAIALSERARSRPRRRGRTAGAGPCGCWTERRLRNCPGRCIRRRLRETSSGPHFVAKWGPETYALLHRPRHHALHEVPLEREEHDHRNHQGHERPRCQDVDIAAELAYLGLEFHGQRL